MTSTTHHTLTRSVEGRWLAGVCAGVARRFNTSTWVVRAIAVVLTLLGGAGAIIYLAAALLLPRDDGREALAKSALGEAAAGPVVAALALGLVVAVAIDGFFALGVGLLVALGVLAITGLDRRDPATEATTTAVTVAAPAEPPTVVDEGVRLDKQGTRGLRPIRGPLDRDRLRDLRGPLLVFSGVVLLFGVTLAAFAAVGATGDDGGVDPAVVLAVGAGIFGALAIALVGARRRWGAWLLIPGLMLAIPAGGLMALGIDLRGGWGDTTVRPTQLAELDDPVRHGAGRMRVDLRRLDLPAGTTRIRVEQGAGQLNVVVPPGVSVETDTSVGAGDVEIFGNQDDGVGIDRKDLRAGRRGAPRVILDVELGAGELVISERPVEWNGGGRDGGPFGTLTPVGLAG